MLWGKIVFWLRIGAVIFVGLVTVGYALQQAEFIEISPKLETAVWIVGLVVIAVDNLGTLVVRGIHRRITRRRNDVEKALMSMLIQLSKGKKLRFEELGASVYFAKRVRRWSHRRAGLHTLKRVHRFRPGGFPPQSGISWHSNVGTVGECWQQKKTRHWDGLAIAKRWDRDSLDELTADSFSKISVKTRQGFTLDEFRAIAGKYVEILASPIWDSHKERTIIGVLSVDRAVVVGDDEVILHLGSSSTRETVEITCRTLGTQLRNKDDG